MLSARQVWLAIDATSGLGPAKAQELAIRLSDAGLGLGDLVGMSGENLHEVTGLSESLSFALAHELSIGGHAGDDDENLLTPADAEYPLHRFPIANPPLPVMLWACGRRSLLTDGSPSLGVAGSRHTDDELIEAAHAIGSLAATQGWLIVSGLAAGVDSAAHQGVLDRGGSTVGVLANGTAAKGRHWQPDTLDDTCIVSQFQPTEPWSGPRAMQRNSTIAALSDRVVIVASGDSGGSWEMGQLCLKRKKPLFVLDVDTEAANGNQRLIAAGATAVSLDDMAVLFAADSGGVESPTLF